MEKRPRHFYPSRWRLATMYKSVDASERTVEGRILIN